MKESISVLIVDDDQQIINLLIHALKKNLGHDVRAFVARDEATAIHSNKVDIALVEFSLPTMSFRPDHVRTKGLEIIREIKRKSPDTIMIALSSHSKEGERLIAAGADYFIADNYNYDKLTALLKKVVTPPMSLF